MKKMDKKYVVATADGAMYRSFSRMPIPSYCFSTSDVDVYATRRYNGARKFRSLHWATHRARFLSNHTDQYYYVFTSVKEIKGNHIMQVIDPTINDKLKESERKTYEELEQIIEDWRIRKNRKSD